MYQPGLHLICDCLSSKIELLSDYIDCQQLLNEMIQHQGLSKIGEVYHNFPTGGFTGVVCLTESHISIHTWPEFGRITFDVFLSNYQKVNDKIAHTIYDKLIELFNAKVIASHEIKR
ncbi:MULTISPECIES: adenosylmethionine decarboxylase [unclassified Arcicella]|uniref:adenosylmethionine decarboxylase n=1 Tax=unclassified Arcicella TaxID=2644986 RepID=UPI0028583167|nr:MULTISPECIES: adenosylmethionine decarboxylase [unclassified Arcicella]MDR6561597.1 S-adenosylmethionine decarboxylase [Arcicella sp. BE51]MDR6812377.1 S-adenosylmethionine decarboxylase [Arcicella sp. BE140]MDR6823851.1 S-adenosylmethionine decarboxylase [Arcicella sp. BE139]